MEFDYQTERCGECDGHWQHSDWCSWASDVSEEDAFAMAEDAAMEAHLFGDC